MKYASGIATQKRIMEVCKRLFYEKGIEETTYVDICAAAEVHPGTLTHHFREKANIASEIYLNASHTLSLEIAGLFTGEDQAQRMLLEIYVPLYVMYHDDAYARFFVEYLALDIHGGIYMKCLPGILQDISGHTPGEDPADMERMEFRAVAYRGMQAAMSYYIHTHQKNIPVETAFGYWARFFLLLQEIQGRDADTRIRRALAQVSDLDISWDGLYAHARRRSTEPSPL